MANISNPDFRMKDTSAVQAVNRFNVTPDEIHAELKSVVLWMYDHGISQLSLDRKDAKVAITLS